ncbi:MAG: (d)CMP kinase [Actinomycetota bacterium]|nr:(d)CMP kinase [Actinomycetota bacterium]
MSVVAIDGPAGAGKSTVARAVAKELGWDYLDTGAMYRAVTLAVLERGINPSEEKLVAHVARQVDFDARGERILLDGVDVSDRIRAEDVTEAVSMVSAQPPVRRALAEKQRRLAETSDVVIEGRDIGTVVAPDAVIKVFLTASISERARRRALQVGLDPSGDVLGRMGESLTSRDERDTNREVSPLTKAPDALDIDTSDRTVDEITQQIVGAVRERISDG